MFHANCNLVLSETLEPEPFVRKCLQVLEADFRQLALSVLADWEATGLVSNELFQAIATLQRPSWGAWNGLLLGLARARRSVLRHASANERQRVEQARLLAAAWDALDQSISDSIREPITPLCRLTGTTLTGRARLGQALTLPITLRNRVEHDRPTDVQWWQAAATGLRALLEQLVELDPFGAVAERATFPHPWFMSEDSQLWSFNGLNKDGSAVFVSDAGSVCHRSGEGEQIVIALKKLLGKSEVHEADFRRLLGKLAPEEFRGVLLGDYLLGRKIGEGGFASVHVGRQLSTGRKVALKVLRDGLADEARARLKQEAEFLSQLDHPHIVGVYGYGEDVWVPPRGFSLADESWYQQWADSSRKKCFIALEWIDGQTLEEVFQQLAPNGMSAVESIGEPPPTRQMAEWFLQATEALSAVHAAGFIHRDLKPSNLMINSQGRLKVMDFGVARSQLEARSLITTAGRELGTPEYMSPEQLRASNLDEIGPASDVYSLCATFYELFTGRRLFDHDTTSRDTVREVKLRGIHPTSPRMHDRQLPWELDCILSLGLEAEAADRYETMASLGRDLSNFLNYRPLEKRRPSLGRRVRLWYCRNPAVATLVTILALLLASVASGSSVAAVRFDRLRNDAVAARDDAVAAKTQADDQRDQARKRLVFARKQLDAFLSVWNDLPRQHMTTSAIVKIMQAEEELVGSVQEYYQDILHGKADDDPEIYRNYALAVKGLVKLKLETGDITGSTEDAKRAVEMLQQIKTNRPDDEVQGALIEVSNALCEAYVRSGQFQEVEDLMDRQEAWLGQEVAGAGSHEGEGHDRASSLNNYATALRMQGRFDEAELVLHKARQLRETMGQRSTEEFLRSINDMEIAGILSNLAIIHQHQGRLPDAIAVSEEARELLDRIPPELFASSDRFTEQHHHLRASVLGNLARLLLLDNQPRETIRTANAALIACEQLDSKVEQFQIVRARCYSSLAAAYLAIKDVQSAKESCHQFTTTFSQRDAERFGSLELLGEVALIYQMQATFEHLDGRFEEAIHLIERSELLLARAGSSAFGMVGNANRGRIVSFFKPHWLASLGRYDESLKLCDEFERTYPDDSSLRNRLDFVRLECEAAQGDYGAAVLQSLIKSRQLAAQGELPPIMAFIRIHALAAWRARDDSDPELTPRMRDQRSNRYALKAISELQSMRDSGLLESPETLAELKHAHCFGLLRQREDFQEILRDLGARRDFASRTRLPE